MNVKLKLPALDAISCVGIIGVGLIGGSLAKALRQSGQFDSVIGYARRESKLKQGVRAGVLDDYCTDIGELVHRADLVVVATPVLSIEATLEEIKPYLRADTIVTDAGSAKGTVLAACERVFGRVPERFVPGHPIAGSELSGIDAANERLFERHKVILTPQKDCDSGAVQTVSSVWELAGAEVITMDADYHDHVLAVTSHLPHLLAYSLVDTLALQDDNLEIFRYAAGGFRDFTRIAASDPTMWHDIFMANRTAVLEGLDAFEDGLQRLRCALEKQDSAKLMTVFSRAKSARDHLTNILNNRAYMSQQENQIQFVASGGGPVTGQIRVPSDKSVSHRSVMLGAIAEGVTDIEGFLEGEDSLATLQAFRDMGVLIEGPHDGRVRVHGVGLHGLSAPKSEIYVGNSGTSIRLLSGLLAAQTFSVTLTGDESLAKRPMERVAKPLRLMGAEIDSNDGKPPLVLKGDAQLQGLSYELPVASAQVKSCILLAGLYAKGETTVVEPAPTRDHTERMLRGFGYHVETVELAPGRSQISVIGGGKLTGSQIDVPADISSAAFFMVAAAITPGSDLLLEHVGVNPTRIGIINILRAMGADLAVENERTVGGEPVADIHVRYSALKGIDIPVEQVPLAIDEFPVLFIAAACAEGTTRLTEAEELRVKESDRIQVMVDGLVALGVDVTGTPDGAVIHGSEISGGIVESHGDHRIAMAFAVASLRSTNPIKINDCANVATSFPNFIEIAAQTGLRVSEQPV